MRFLLLDPAPSVSASGALLPRDPRGAGAEPLGARRMDRYQRLGFAAVERALEDVPEAAADAARGVILGSSLGCWASNAEFFLELGRARLEAQSAALFARTVASSVNGEVSIARRIGGVNETFVSGWTAGAEALQEAASLLAEGKARSIVAGGVEAPDEVLLGLHRAAREEPARAWLPETLEAAAAVCLLTREASPDRIRVRAVARGYDPEGRWSLARALAGPLEALGIASVVVANSVPPALLARLRHEARGRNLVLLPEREGELGAAGAAAAVGLAASSREATLVLARGIEGSIAALALGA